MQSEHSRGEVQAFYDDYVGRQAAVGVNQRHRAILGWLRRFGLRPGNNVLEIGCGIGTVTGLIAEAVAPAGSVVGIDLSPESIQVARQRLAPHRNATVSAGDVLEMSLSETFDVVVLPDVIEHIPISLHEALFARLSGWLKPQGFILFHYPNPHHLAWCVEHRPDEVQIIDQPIHLHHLATTAHNHGLYIDFLQTYSIWVRDGDYVVAVVRPIPDRWDPTELPERRPSLISRVARRIGG